MVCLYILLNYATCENVVNSKNNNSVKANSVLV